MKSRSMFHLVSLLVMLFSLLGSAATPIPVSANIPAGLTASDWGQILALLTPAQQAYIKASNSGADDNFGKVALDGDTLVVGASGESSNATGINGNQLDNSASSAGAVYVFVRSGNTWSQQAYIKASNTDANDYFGSSIAIAGDTIVVGAYGEDSNATGINGNETNNSAATSGAVYVFTRTGSTWSQQAYIKA
ncbi:MAG TPA: FG-GAP repeat protein, partial [Anaerolineales bacterium]|nr:FG-GAP repeat protein [Anaerolineales bacterium]